MVCTNFSKEVIFMYIRERQCVHRYISKAEEKVSKIEEVAHWKQLFQKYQVGKEQNYTKIVKIGMKIVFSNFNKPKIKYILPLWSLGSQSPLHSERTMGWYRVQKCSDPIRFADRENFGRKFRTLSWYLSERTCGSVKQKHPIEKMIIPQPMTLIRAISYSL